MLEILGGSGTARPAGLPRQARIVEIRAENYRTATLVLDLHLAAQPGQFVMAWLPGLDEKPFSLAAADPVTLTVSRVGPFSEALHCLRPGDRLGIRGPFGHGFEVHGEAVHGGRALLAGGDQAAPAGGGGRVLLAGGDEAAGAGGGRVLLAGGGYGVAPLGFLAERLLAAGHAPADLTVVIGARTAADVLTGRFRSLGIEPLITTEDATAGTPGRITQLIAPLLQARHAFGTPDAPLSHERPVDAPLLRVRPVDALYACGPNGMLEALEQLALQAGVPAQLSWEAHMRCGIGVCGSCQHGDGLLVCRDGPVLPAGARGCRHGEEAA